MSDLTGLSDEQLVALSDQNAKDCKWADAEHQPAIDEEYRAIKAEADRRRLNLGYGGLRHTVNLGQLADILMHTDRSQLSKVQPDRTIAQLVLKLAFMGESATFARTRDGSVTVSTSFGVYYFCLDGDDTDQLSTWQVL